MKRFFTLFIILLFTIFSIFEVKSQDARFSQLYANPLLLNPAMTGIYEGKFRFVANYRELYSSVLQNTAFKTISSSFDIRFPVQRNDYAGFGINVLRDDVGLANFSRFQTNLGGSFMKKLKGSRYNHNSQFLVVGGQLGVGQRGYNWDGLWFSQQYNEETSAVDFSANNGENFSQDNTGLYLNFNAGLMWYTVLEDNASFYIGGALHHVNTPNISFLGNKDEILHRRWVGHLGGELPLNKQLSLLPAAAVFTQNKSMSTTAGANFRYTNREWKEVALRTGGWLHFSNRLESGFLVDAFIIMAVLETEKWNFGLSYDITTSSLTDANNARGAFEISLTYIHPEKRKYRLECPKY